MARPPAVDTRPPLEDDVRSQLVELYAADVAALAARVPDIDLTRWPNFAYLATGNGASGGRISLGVELPDPAAVAGVSPPSVPATPSHEAMQDGRPRSGPLRAFWSCRAE